LSIGSGVWDNTGVVKSESGQRNVTELTRQGVRTFSPERGASLFAWLCGHRKPYVAVSPIDWATFRRVRSGRHYPLFKTLLAAATDADDQERELSARLARAGLAERRQMLDRVVRAAVGTVLKTAPSRLDPRKGLGTMGLTSLMAIELRNRLEAALKRPLSATLAWNHPTVEALVAHLAGAEPAAPSAVAAVEPLQPVTELSDRLSRLADLSDEQAIAELRLTAAGAR
jgi:myxalamid-type polyketide synthase MxaE and MxaD